MSIRKRTKKYNGIGNKRKLSKLENFLGSMDNMYKLPRYNKAVLEYYIMRMLD